MIFVPTAVGKSGLKWPRDKWLIALLPLWRKQAWYAAQEPQDLVTSSKEFQAWWAKWYIKPLKIKRFLHKLHII